MALTVDATGTELNQGGVASPLSYTGITVGSGASQLLVLFTSNAATLTGAAGTWDSGGTNQAMTLLGQQASASTPVNVAMFGLLNPTAGNKTLSLSWTSSTASVLGVCAISFTGGETSSIANSFKSFVGGAGTTLTSTLTVSGAAGNISVCHESLEASAAAPTATSSTALYTPSNSNAGQAAARAPSASSLVWTINPAGTAEWAACAIDVAVAAASSPVIPRAMRSRTYLTR